MRMQPRAHYHMEAQVLAVAVGSGSEHAFLGWDLCQ